ALRDVVALNQFQRRLLQSDFSARDGFAQHYRLAGDIHHAGIAAFVDVGQFAHNVFCAGVSTDCFHSRAAVRICSATFNFGFTNFGVNHGKAPIKSGVTRICPSQSGPEPIPMVGIEIFCVISFATAGVTISKTSANAPASSKSCASRMSAWCSASLRPLIL